MEFVFGENVTELSGIFDKILKSTKEMIAEGNQKIRDKRDVKIREQREKDEMILLKVTRKLGIKGM